MNHSIKHNINNSSKWVCRFWKTVHHDSISKSFHEVLSTLDTWSVFIFNTTWLFRFFICDFLLANPFLSFSTPSFTKQNHYPKSSLFLLIPISKQYYTALVVHNSIFIDHVNTTLCLCNMMTLIKRYGCIVFTYSLKMLLWLIRSSVAICLPIWRKTHIVLHTITFIPYVIQWKQPPRTFLLE